MFSTRRLGCLLAAFVSCSILWAQPGGSQQPDPTTPSNAAGSEAGLPANLDRAAIQARLKDVEGRRRALEAPGASDHDRARMARLQRLKQVLEDQLARLDPDSSRPTDPSAPLLDDTAASPLALNALYEMRRGLERLETREKTLESSLRETLGDARNRLEDAERARRRARTDLEQASAATRRDAQQRLALRELDSEIAREEVNLAALELRSATLAPSHSADLAAIDARIAEMRAAHVRGDHEPGAALTALTRRENELRRAREATARRLASIELRLSAAENRFAREGVADQEALAEAEALTALRDVVRSEIALIDLQSERLTSQQRVWQIWTQVLQQGEAAPEDAESWSRELSSRLDGLAQAEIRAASRAADRERALDALDEQLAALPADSDLADVLSEERDALARLHSAQLAEARSIAEDRRLTERTLADVRGDADALDLAEAAHRVRGVVADTWNYELLVIDDSPITVGALILAAILFAVSVRVSNWGARSVRGLAERRFALDPGGAQAFQTLTFYVLLVGFGLLALRAVHFPLTAFTFLGGALAIGVGFGSQNVMNNFISGLILMLERPVRAHDMVEVDGNHGIIERIGARSTQIRSTDGRHIIVPNSFFLESNVVNWTLSDDLIRTSVVVGVIYGSPTRLVEELIQRVVRANAEILDEPAPIILFEEFGDNSLNFSVHFWVRARSPMATRRVESRVRFEIDDVFREHDLVIAFPQRDVHLDSVSPIEVKLMDAPS